MLLSSFVGPCTLLFYVIIMNVASLFANSSLLFPAILNLYCIHELYQLKKINIVYFIFLEKIK